MCKVHLQFCLNILMQELYKADSFTSSDIVTFRYFFHSVYFYRIDSRLLKTAAGFYPLPPSAIVHPETPVKQCLYVRAVVCLICRCSFLKEVKQESLAVALNNLMSEIETVLAPGWKFIVSFYHYIAATVHQWSYTEKYIIVIMGLQYGMLC